MKATVELPDDLFRDLKVRAAEERTTVRLVVIRALVKELRQPRIASSRRVSLPLVTLPGDVTLPVLTNAEIDELPG